MVAAMKMKTAAPILIGVLALVLIKALVAGYVALVHRFWEPETRWQWAFLNAVLGGGLSALLTQNPAYAAFMVVACFIGGALLGGIVEPGMGFVDVFLWPL